MAKKKHWIHPLMYTTVRYHVTLGTISVDIYQQHPASFGIQLYKFIYLHYPFG
jgi:hypothetical protein